MVTYTGRRRKVATMLDKNNMNTERRIIAGVDWKLQALNDSLAAQRRDVREIVAVVADDDVAEILQAIGLETTRKESVR